MLKEKVSRSVMMQNTAANWHKPIAVSKVPFDRGIGKHNLQTMFDWQS